MGTESWIEGLPAAVTVTDSSGRIVAMNARSRETFAADGGGALIGRSLFDCHPEPSRTKVQELYRRREANSYTIEKNGERKIIHQLPWFIEGTFGGLVEISIPIPDSLPISNGTEPIRIEPNPRGPAEGRGVGKVPRKERGCACGNRPLRESST